MAPTDPDPEITTETALRVPDPDALCDHGMSASLCEGPDHYAPDDHGAPPATMADAHAEWHRNTGIPIGTPGCPQDACHDDDQDHDDVDEPGELVAVHVPADHRIPAAVVRIPHTLAAMRAAIGGGWLEAARTTLDPGSVVMWCDEEGKLKGLGTNLRATVLARTLLTPEWSDPLAGDVLITSQDGPDATDVTPEILTAIRGRLDVHGEDLIGSTDEPVTDRLTAGPGPAPSWLAW